MPATSIAINLLGREELAHSPQGRIITWALTYGRYIMIGTEIIVLLAFISRFSLDRKLSDLKDEITQKQSILEANLPFEQEIIRTQNELGVFKELIGNQQHSLDIMTLLQSTVPPGVSLEAIKIGEGKLTADAVSGSTGSFALFLSNLQKAKQISRVEIADITKSATTGIVFKITATLTSYEKK